MDPRFARVDDEKRLTFDLHPGQAKAWQSSKRFVAITAGTQSGKTIFGPLWLIREIELMGPGDYIVAAPTYPTLRKKVLPSFLWLFERTLRAGTYNKSDHIFTFSPEGARRLFGEDVAGDLDTFVFFGHADDPDSLESATAKGAWLDECGQRFFRLESYEAIIRRLSIHEGRVLFTTTLYNLGWYVQQIYRPAERGERDDIELVNFPSILNPAFPQHEYDRMQRLLPRWKFDLFYRGVPSRPAGTIYGNFDEERDVCSPFKIPDDWPRYVGMDFGGVNTAALFYAEDPSTRIDGEVGSGRLYLYREYWKGGRTSAEHTEALRRNEPMPQLIAGGAPSEDQWRREFKAESFPVERPKVSDVNVGISRVFKAHAEARIKVFETCTGYLDEKASYSRVLGPDNEPTEEIADKSTYHFMDAERYIISSLDDWVPFGFA